MKLQITGYSCNHCLGWDKGSCGIYQLCSLLPMWLLGPMRKWIHLYWDRSYLYRYLPVPLAVSPHGSMVPAVALLWVAAPLANCMAPVAEKIQLLMNTNLNYNISRWKNLRGENILALSHTTTLPCSSFNPWTLQPFAWPVFQKHNDTEWRHTLPVHDVQGKKEGLYYMWLHLR